ncbi:hypothetical protein LEMLEM_LOCUS13667 [Lemmus lemmus]
MPQTRT